MSGSISLLEIGAHAHKVKHLMVLDTLAAWDEIYTEERRVLVALAQMGLTVGRGLRVFLWRDGDMEDAEICVSLANREIFRWLHDEFIDAVDEVMSGNMPPFTGPASSSGFGWPPGGMMPAGPPRRVAVSRKTLIACL